MRIKFLNTYVDNLTMDEVINNIDNLIKMKKHSYVVTPNLDHIVQLEKDVELREAYKEADLILADGKPLIWISKLYNKPIKEKISGSDLFPKLCKMAAEKGYSMFFLGAAEGVADKASENLRAKYSGLKIVGTYSPPYGFEKNESILKQVVTTVCNAKPDILIVALGCPKQEIFMYHYCKDMNVPISLGLGASLDFEAGKIKRAPKWMSDFGFEWLYRMFQDPRRLFKRYWNDAINIIPIIRKYK